MALPGDDAPETPEPVPRPPTIFVDADACPVREEVFRVASRYAMPVRLVANSVLRVPAGGLVEMVHCPGFGAADDWIAAEIGPRDIAITADLPLIARCLSRGARVLHPNGRQYTENDIGAALAMRELKEELRQRGENTGGPAAMTPKDRSRFLSKLDELVNAVRRGRPGS